MVSFENLLEEIDGIKDLLETSDIINFFALRRVLDYLKLGDFDKAKELLNLVLSKNSKEFFADFVDNWIFIIEDYEKEGFYFNRKGNDFEFITFSELVERGMVKVNKKEGILLKNYNNLFGKLYIPSYIKTIREQCFFRAHYNEIILPENIQEIEKAAFSESYLKKIRIPEGINIISRDCFSNCTKLKEVSFPISLERIEPEAFRGCDSLKEVNLFEKIESLGESSFYECKNLETLNIKQNKLFYIGESAFERCENLKEFTIQKGSGVSVGKSAFLNCSNLVVNIYSDNYDCYFDSFRGCKKVNECFEGD